MNIDFKKIFLNPYTISLVLGVLIVIGLIVGTMFLKIMVLMMNLLTTSLKTISQVVLMSKVK
jgi:hypothetical protein